MSTSVLIVGAGQLGSRYLQSLKKVKSSLNIYVVDINQNSLNIAKDRWDEIEQYRHATYLFLSVCQKDKYF